MTARPFAVELPDGRTLEALEEGDPAGTLLVYHHGSPGAAVPYGPFDRLALAFTRPWGFLLSSIRVPVSIWQGGQDLFVPFAHGRWLADHVPGARTHLYPEEGHLSIGVGKLDAILDDLLESAGGARG